MREPRRGLRGRQAQALRRDSGAGRLFGGARMAEETEGIHRDGRRGHQAHGQGAETHGRRLGKLAQAARAEVKAAAASMFFLERLVIAAGALVVDEVPIQSEMDTILHKLEPARYQRPGEEHQEEKATGTAHAISIEGKPHGPQAGDRVRSRRCRQCRRCRQSGAAPPTASPCCSRPWRSCCPWRLSRARARTASGAPTRPPRIAAHRPAVPAASTARPS